MRCPSLPPVVTGSEQRNRKLSHKRALAPGHASTFNRLRNTLSGRVTRAFTAQNGNVYSVPDLGSTPTAGAERIEVDAAKRSDARCGRLSTRRARARSRCHSLIWAIVLVWGFMNIEHRNLFLFVALSVFAVVLSTAATAEPSSDATPPSMSALKDEFMKIHPMPGSSEVGHGRETVNNDRREFGHGFRLKGPFASARQYFRDQFLGAGWRFGRTHGEGQDIVDVYCKGELIGSVQFWGSFSKVATQLPDVDIDIGWHAVPVTECADTPAVKL
jgi:hypothetical protein